jgi:hypothetical protein
MLAFTLSIALVVRAGIVVGRAAGAGSHLAASVAAAGLATIVVALAPTRTDPGRRARVTRALVHPIAEHAVIARRAVPRGDTRRAHAQHACLLSVTQIAVVAIPVPAAYLCLSGGREPEEETDGEEQLRPCHPSPGLYANAFLFHPRPRALRCARRHSGPRIAPERRLE